MRISDAYNVGEYRSRATIVAVAFTLLLGFLVLRLWYLQLWRGDEYREFADRNRFKTERLAAPRGQVLDRDGRLLADSRPSFDVKFTRGYASDAEHELNLIQKIFEWTPEQFEKTRKKIFATPKYRDVLIGKDVSWDVLAQIQNSSLELSGVNVEVIAVRDYLYHDSFFHVLGYMGEINDLDLDRLQIKYPERKYRLGDQLGVVGVELLYESVLRGHDGQELTVVDARGRRVNHDGWTPIGQGQTISPTAGNSVQLSLDAELQQEAVKALGDHVGSAFAMDPQTGEVLAMVSRPAIDPNLFSRGIGRQKFNELRSQEFNPFLDRSVGEHYPPGSTLKVILAAMALQLKVVDEKTTFYCPGFFRFGRRTWRCHKAQGHGTVDVHKAIKESCDVFFYNSALLMGLDTMNEWAFRFGLGRRTRVGQELFEGKLTSIQRFNSEQPGFIPSSAWIESAGQSSIEGETINAGIGQGGFLVTAAQLARMTASLGNGGKIFQPQMVRRVMTPDGKIIKDYHARLENQIQMDPKVTKIVLDAMLAVVNEPGGTAVLSRIPNINFGGKTGTAQVIRQAERVKHIERLQRDFRDHSLFIGMAPMENPKIAVAVIVENGGHGSTVAAPIAKAMVKNYLERKVASTEPKTEAGVH